MSNKAILTPELIDAQIPPKNGELWFPDTKVAGFGLRLWAGANGGGAAYCLRAKDDKGRWTRRQFKPWDHGRPPYDVVTGSYKVPQTLGAWLATARDWARDEKFRVSGQHTPQDQKHLTYLENRRFAERQTLGWHLLRFLDANKLKWSDNYADMISSAIDEFIPQGLMDHQVVDVQPVMVVEALVKPGRPLSKVRALRSYITKMVEHESTFGAGFKLRSNNYSTEFWEKVRLVWRPEFELRHQRFESFKALIFKSLEQENTNIVSAAFLRMYLQTGGKQKPLMAARWNMIVEGYWYPYLPNDRQSWFEAREKLSDELLEFLDAYRATIGECEYLFPASGQGRLPHIDSIDRYWKRTMGNVGWDVQSLGTPLLKEFGEVCESRNTPSYYRDSNELIFSIVSALDREEKEKVSRILSKLVEKGT